MTTLGETAQSFWQKMMFARSISVDETSESLKWYNMLEGYYLNNGLYDSIDWTVEKSTYVEGQQSIRNPANRAVEFHVAHLWPGPLEKALPIIADKKQIIEPIQQVWKWSNFGVQKQLAARWYSLFGNMFIKVATSSENRKVTKVKQSQIKAKNVIEFSLDDYGYVTYIRIDVPTTRRVDGIDENYTHTEIWDKFTQMYKLYEHKYGQAASLNNLGDPKETRQFSEFGIDFIPIVHAKFRDTGNDRGDGVFVHALDKIDEANRMATRLHQMLFRYNKPTQIVMSVGTDASGKPLPPPKLTDADGNVIDAGDTMEQKDDELMMLPGATDVKQLVPDLAYGDMLNILNAQMQELEQDLPEMAYYRLKELGEISGRAVKLMLSDAIDRALEARGNAETALIRANQIALTLAQKNRLQGFENLGTFEAGEFDHSFAERDVIPTSDLEKSEAVAVDVGAGMDLLFSMKQHGYTQEEIDELKASPEYRIRMAKMLFEAASAVQKKGVPMETFLMQAGWDEKMMKQFGTQKLAAIKMQQEDVVPETGL